MDAPTHFHDVTNLAASARNSAAHHQEAIMSSRSAQSEAAQQSHTTITPDASYDDGSQHMLMKQKSSRPRNFRDSDSWWHPGPKEADGCNAAASNDGSRIHNVDASGHSRQLDMSAPLRQANAPFHDPHDPSLEQEIAQPFIRRWATCSSLLPRTGTSSPLQTANEMHRWLRTISSRPDAV